MAEAQNQARPEQPGFAIRFLSPVKVVEHAATARDASVSRMPVFQAPTSTQT